MIRTSISMLVAMTAISFGQDRPNFVFIISEDNSKHFIKHFDSTGMATPNIEALAKDGVTFDAACSNGAVCSVARTTLLTGCYTPRIGAQFHRKQHAVPMPKGLKPFPYYLKQAGYYTSNLGKTDYNVSIDFKESWSGKKGWRGRKGDQPFFFQLSSLNQSHEGRGHFGKSQIKENEATKEVFVPPHHPRSLTMRYSYAFYQEKMQTIDGLVGETVEQLKKDGVYENTIVFYFGDHGGILPRSKGYAYETGLNPPLIVRFPDKWKHLVPFEKGSRTNANVNFYDFGPSLIKAAGLEVDPMFDGKPFLGEGISKAEVEQNPAYGHADRFDEKYDLVRTLRRGNMKYMRSYQPYNPDGLHNFYRYKSQAYLELRQMFREGKLNKAQQLFFKARSPEALYDLSKDPYELNNLAADPNYAKKLHSMREELGAYTKQVNDLSFFPESHLIAEAFDDPTSYGKKHHQLIAELVDIADLQLKAYEEAKPALLQALDSENKWKRYWACITAAHFAKPELSEKIEAIASNDQIRMVRVRAAEYLANIGQSDKAIQIISKAAMETEDPVELNLILNSAAVVYEMDPAKNKFKLPRKQMKAHSNLVKERLEYLTK